MNFKNYSYGKTVDYTKLEMPFGTYYLGEKFFIGELYEGVHFDWEKTEFVLQKLVDFYGNDSEIGFISNRINHYSVDPYNWTKMEEKYKLIIASAIVVYNNSNFMNASIEKKFTSKSIKRCLSLHEAIKWMENLREFN